LEEVIDLASESEPEDAGARWIGEASEFVRDQGKLCGGLRCFEQFVGELREFGFLDASEKAQGQMEIGFGGPFREGMAEARLSFAAPIGEDALPFVGRGDSNEEAEFHGERLLLNGRNSQAGGTGL
jgi:hypothetical protein